MKKKLLKVLKWYAILDVATLAVIGFGEVVHQINNNPDKSVMENDEIVIDRAVHKIKKSFTK